MLHDGFSSPWLIPKHEKDITISAVSDCTLHTGDISSYRHNSMPLFLKISRTSMFSTVFQEKYLKSKKDIAIVKLSTRTCCNINLLSPKVPLLFESITYPIPVYVSSTQNNT